MSFTKAKNPVNDSGFDALSLGSVRSVWAYMLFFVGILISLGLAQNVGVPFVNSLLSSVTGGRLSATGGSDPWEGW